MPKQLDFQIVWHVAASKDTNLVSLCCIRLISLYSIWISYWRVESTQYHLSSQHSVYRCVQKWVHSLQSSVYNNYRITLNNWAKKGRTQVWHVEEFAYVRSCTMIFILTSSWITSPWRNAFQIHKRLHSVSDELLSGNCGLQVYPILKQIISVKILSDNCIGSWGKFTVKDACLSHWVGTQQDWKGKDICYKPWIRKSSLNIVFNDKTHRDQTFVPQFRESLIQRSQ